MHYMLSPKLSFQEKKRGHPTEFKSLENIPRKMPCGITVGNTDKMKLTSIGLSMGILWTVSG